MVKKPNAYFSYSGRSFGVYLTKMSYTWEVMKKGASQGRQAQTVYPFRMVQGDLNVELQFPGISDRDSDGNGWKKYREFCDFIRSYHLLCTSSSGIMGDGVPFMYFSCSSIPSKTTAGNGMSVTGGIRYAVTVPSIDMKFSNDMVVQTINLTLGILSDDSGDVVSTGASSYASGRWSDVLSIVTVNKAEVAAKGDDAYVATTNATTNITKTSRRLGKSYLGDETAWGGGGGGSFSGSGGGKF